MIRRFLVPFALVTALLALGCNKDDPPQPEPAKAASCQVTVLFSPGQLGDKGYSDSIMEGLNYIDSYDNEFGGDSLDVTFLTPSDMEDSHRSVVQWAKSPARSFAEGEYQRRLLVLTEPMMEELLPDIQSLLRPNDEIVFMKLLEEDVEQISERYSLENRIHGLTVLATGAARRYCQEILRWKNEYEGYLPGIIQIPVYRLYDPLSYSYRDGIIETMQQELGEDFSFYQIGLSDMSGAQTFSYYSAMSMVEAAFDSAKVAKYVTEISGVPYVIVDLGAGNAGWDYFLMSESFADLTIQTLMLDAKDNARLSRHFIDRNFGLALSEWVFDWVKSPVGSMPVQTTHDDENYYDTNI